jgi:lipopolysaccharide exporter
MSKEEKHYWIRSGSYSFLERIFGQILGFANMFLLLRAVSKNEYGLWIQFLIIVALIEVSRTGLIQNALIRYLSTSEEKDKSKINTASIFINVCLTSLTISLLLLLANPAVNYFYTDPEFTESVKNELIQMLYYYGFTTIVIMPFLQFNYILQANLDFKGFFWSSFTYKGTLFLYILYQYLNNIPIDIFKMSLFLIFSGLTASVVGYIFVKKYLVFSRNIDWKWVKELFNFGRFTFGTNLSTIIYKFTDRSMLGAMISFEAIAIYEVAIRITNLVDIPAISIAAVVFPQSAKNSIEKGKEGIRDLYERSVAVILGLIIPAMIFIYFFAEMVVVILGKDKYLDSVPILKYTILFALFVPYALQFGTILDSIGKPKINFRFVILGLTLNIIFNYFLIKEHGIMGAVWGTLLTYSVMFIIQMSFFYKWYGIRPWRPIALIPWFYKNLFNTVLGFLKKK